MTRAPDMHTGDSPHGARLADIVFAGGGALGAFCRSFDWAATPLGPIEGWPQSLRTAAQTTVSSGLPSIVLWGRELIQIYNDSYARIIHAKHPRALGHGNQEIWPEVWHINGPIFERVFAGETVTHEDALYPLRRGDAVEDVYLTLSFSPIRDERGEVGGVLANMRETTDEVAVRALQADRERLFQALARERERLEFVFRQAPSFLAVMRGPDHVFELANDAYYRIVGDRELIGKPLFEALPEVRNQGFEELLEGVYSRATPFIGREVPVQVGSGSGEPPRQRFLDLVYLPLQDGDGVPSGVIAHGTDVTDHVHARLEVERLLAESESARSDAEAARAEARRSQAEAEEANQAKSQFLANMSHEIRTPINAILGYADLLEVGLRGSLTDGQQSYVDRIKASSLHLVGLINEILDFSRIEAGGMHVGREPVGVRETVRAALAMILPQAQVKGIEISDGTSCEADLAYSGDGNRVRQILVNLLSNAVKFTPRAGSVAVRCRSVPRDPTEMDAEGDRELGERGPWIAIDVEDTGMGIPPEQLVRIFEPFIQVDAGRTREQGGTGLGLTISQRLARMMDGDLTVRSEVGKGSCFTLWLPAPPEGA